jgi:hypothetical protein
MQFDQMRQREFISLLGGAAASWLIAARAHQAAMPVIGYLSHGTPEGEAAFSAARARIGTPLSDLAEQTSKQIIKGYVVCDRSLRTHYRAPIAETNPTMPFSEAALK